MGYFNNLFYSALVVLKLKERVRGICKTLIKVKNSSNYVGNGFKQNGYSLTPVRWLVHCAHACAQQAESAMESCYGVQLGIALRPSLNRFLYSTALKISIGSRQ